MAERSLHGMNVEDVKAELNRRGLYPHGDEFAVRSRLQEHVNAHPLWANTYGCNAWTALMDAAHCGNKKKAEELLKDPHVLATINQQNRIRGTALYFSVSSMGNFNITRLLTEAGADVDKGTKLGTTPLMRVCVNGDALMARHLLEAGADPTKASNDGSTCFHVAAHWGKVDTIKMLLAPYPWPEGWFVAMLCMQRRANQYLERPDAKPEGVAFLYGGGFFRKVGEFLRPKHLGIKKKHWVTPEWLANAKTRNGKTVLELAKTHGYSKIADAVKDFILQTSGEEEQKVKD